MTGMLRNGIGIYHRKGGVGKTTLTTQMAVMAIRERWKVLVVELDSTSNIAQGLGRTAVSDQGEALAAAVLDARPLAAPTFEDPDRPGLSVVTGGYHTDPMLAGLYSGRVEATNIVSALALLAEEHDVVLVDCPPQSYGFRDAIARSVSHLVVPADPDIGTVYAYYDIAVALSQLPGPTATILGVALVGFDARATVVKRRIRALYESPQIGAHVFGTVVRFSPRVASDLRYLGVDINQYAERALAERAQGANPTTHKYATAGITLRDEYAALSAEILRAHLKERTE